MSALDVDSPTSNSTNDPNNDERLDNISSFWDIIPYKNSKLAIPSLKKNYPFWDIDKGRTENKYTSLDIYVLYTNVCIKQVQGLRTFVIVIGWQQ